MMYALAILGYYLLAAVAIVGFVWFVKRELSQKHFPEGGYIRVDSRCGMEYYTPRVMKNGTPKAKEQHAELVKLHDTRDDRRKATAEQLVRHFSSQ